MIGCDYCSKFDNFNVQLVIGTAEEVNNEMFGGDDVIGIGKSGACIEAANHGCCVWLPEPPNSPDGMASLFHELVHASFIRFRKNGMVGKQKEEDIDEMIATSVSELGKEFLSVGSPDDSKDIPDET